jgi:hypothetical protein
MKANERSISKLNPKDVENAVLAIVALCITQPGIEDDEDGRYDDQANAMMEEYCPLLRAMEDDMAKDTMNEIQSKAFKMLKKLRSSKDPLFRALAGMQRTMVE